jgi:N-acetyl-anhydromuramyl-L-alanine amidase AmpD
MTSYTESPTPQQVQSLLKLINRIKSKNDIKYVLRHSDIAPGRKTDPWNMSELLRLWVYPANKSCGAIFCRIA